MDPARSSHRLLVGAGTRLPAADVSVHARFERIAADHPGRTAAVGPDGRATYAELNNWANAIAKALLDAGVRPEEPIALAVPRSIAQVASVLGVLKAGAAYVPLVANQPDARLRSIVDNAGCRIAVAQQGYLDAVLSAMIHRIEPDLLRRHEEPNPALPIAPDRLAYIMFTSGSTGTPKGAMIEHRGVIRLVCNQEYMPFGPDFHFLYAGPLSFDLSTIEIFTPLLHGARLLISADHVLAPETIRRFVSQNELRGICVSFSLFRALFDADPGAFDAIPTIGVCGEPADPAVIRRAQERLPNATFYNAYGPTECSALTTTHQIPRPCPSRPPVVPIGVPLNGMLLQIVDDAMRVLPPGEVGELLIGGLGVGRGYLNDPGLTASRFITRPEDGRWYRSGDRVRVMTDGVIEYLGRADDQIKVRGQRIELGEIDAALRADPAIRAAASVVIGTGVDARVGACVVPGTEPFDPVAVRRSLSERLMPAMIPAVLITVSELPISRNGKTDRARVREIIEAAPPERPQVGGTATAERPAGSETEVALCALVGSVLGTSVSGVDRGFVALGGHSLQAMMLSMRVRERWGIVLGVPRILSESSITSLAASIDALSKDHAHRPITEVNAPKGPRPLTPQERRLWTVQQMDPGSGVYNIAYRFRFRQGRPERARLEAAWSRLAGRHVALRTAFSGPDEHPPLANLLDTAEAGIHWIAAASGDAPLRDALHEPFDLERPPLARLIIVDGLEPAGYLVMHHIISDAWSMEVMLRDLDAIYRSGDGAGLPRLPPEVHPLLTTHDAELDAERERRARDLAERLRLIPYTALSSDSSDPPTSTDPPTPVATKSGVRDLPRTAQTTVAPVPADIIEQAERLASRLQVTVYAVFLAAYASWVSSLIGRERLCLGLFVSTRDAGPGADHVGFFVETTPVAIEVSHELFENAVRDAAEAAAGSHADRDIPFDRVADLLAGPRDPWRTPVTDIFFNAIDAAPIDHADDAIRVIHPERIEVDHGLARFGLLTTVYRDQSGCRITTAVRSGAAAANGVVPDAHAFLVHVQSLLKNERPMQDTQAQFKSGTVGAVEPWDGRERRSPARLPRSGHVVLIVLSVFREVLDDPSIEPADNFFEMGGNSLHAVRAFAMIRQRLGTNMPAATIFRHPTPERLAAAIRDDPAGLLLRPFLQLTDHPRKRTAYILPGVTGEIVSLGSLVRGLGNRWGCFAAAYPGVSEQTEPIGSIDGLVDHLMSGLDDGFDPTASAMIGYSFGGVIAYELSMRLQAQGRPPRLLVLLDTHLMTRFPTPGHPVPMMTHLENLGRLRGKRRLRYIYRRLLNINRKLKSWRLPGQDHFIDLPHIRRLHDSNLIALQGYRPSGIYNGRVLAVNGHRPDWMLREDDDGANGWCPWLSQPPATLRLDANHVELIRPGFADAISQRIVELAELPKGE